jgi:hypothetical protein
MFYEKYTNKSSRDMDKDPFSQRIRIHITGLDIIGSINVNKTTSTC